MLARMQRKGNPLTVLVGMKTDAATLEKSMEFPQKVKNRTTLRPSSCTTRDLPKDTKTLIQRDTCTSMFTATLSTIAKLWKQPKCPSIDQWIKTIYILPSSTHVVVNGMCAHAHTHTHTHAWVELEGIMLSEISQSEKGKYRMISLICGL